MSRCVPVLLWLAVLGAIAWPLAAAGQPPRESCVACHLEIDDDRLAAPARDFPGDIHAAKGFGCVACHGGDPKAPGMEAMDPAKGYIGVPAGQKVVQVCGRCHSDARFMRQYNPALRVDQVVEYRISVHGQRLFELGDLKVATCSSCHKLHTIRPASDPRSSVHPLNVADTCATCHADAEYMKVYAIPTDQVEKYRRSIHWKTMAEKGDLSAPACNDCHGNHGAAPPGVSWVGHVCGQCHAVVADFFDKSAHRQVFVLMGTPGCATCHKHHDITAASVEMLGLGEQAVCARCHSADDPGGMAAARMREKIDTLRGAYGKAQDVLHKAEQSGMEVSQPLFDLNEAVNALVKARAAVHTFEIEPVQKETEAGLAIAAKAFERGVQALEELQFRRKGLAVSVVIVLVLIGGLVAKIRQVDRQARR